MILFKLFRTLNVLCFPPLKAVRVMTQCLTYAEAKYSTTLYLILIINNQFLIYLKYYS